MYAHFVANTIAINQLPNINHMPPGKISMLYDISIGANHVKRSAHE